MSERWYDKTVAQVEAQLKTSAKTGLSRAEIGKRRRRSGTNDIYPIPRTSFKEYLKTLLTDITSILLFVTVLIAFAMQKTYGILIMAVIILIYYFIAIFTYVKSQRILEQMGDYALPDAKVMRDGRLYMIKLAQVVPGDLIFLSAGDIIPCDARIIEAVDFEVAETNLTSVTHSVAKSASFIEHRDIAPSGQRNMVFASTIVTKGTARAIACNTGSDTLVCAMGKNAPLISHDKLKILLTLKKYCRTCSLVMSALVFLVTVLDIVIGFGARNIFDSFMSGLTLAVSSMSEFYAAFGYIIIACGIFGAVKKYKDVNSGALIKNSSKLETMKDITCLIVPKEGAFSIMDMQVERIFANDEIYAKGEHGYERNAAELLRYAVLSTGMYGADKLILNNLSSENLYSPEEDALIYACEACGVSNAELGERYPLIEHASASASLPIELSLFTDIDGANTISARGEANFMIDRCRYISEYGERKPMTKDKIDELKIATALATKEGARVVAVATAPSDFNTLKKVGTALGSLTLIGLVMLKEPMLPGAAKNVSKCLSAGIKVIMLTEDTCENNKFLAKSLGIIKSEDEAIDSRSLAAMKEGLFRANIPIYHLYQGLNSSQKLKLLRALKDSGEKVAVLGGTIEDIAFVREADVGMAQSVTISAKAARSGVDLSKRKLSLFSKAHKAKKIGCDALKFVSDVIVSEADVSGTGGFNAVTGALMCSKVIYLNLLRMAKYLMISQISRILIVFYGAISGNVLLSPAQILACGLIVDFAAVLTIAFERPDPYILESNEDVEKTLKNPFLGTPQSLILGVCFSVVTIIANMLMTRYSFISGAEQTLSCSFISYVATQLVILNETIRVRSIFKPNIRLNRVYTVSVLIIAFIIAAAFLIPSFGAALQITAVPAIAICGIAAPPICMLIILEIYKAITG